MNRIHVAAALLLAAAACGQSAPASTATVAAGDGSSNAPSGTVTFADGESQAPLGEAALQSSPGFSDLNTAVGPNSAGTQQIVNQDGTIVSMTADTNSPDAGQPVNLTVQVIDTADAGTPTGAVDLFDGYGSIATTSLDGGFATFQLGSLTPGLHALTAHYEGDTNSSSGVSPQVDVTIVANTVLTLSSSENPSNFGDRVVITANVSFGGVACRGGVSFFDGEGFLGGSALDQSGNGSIQSSALEVGNHFLSAFYEGADDMCPPASSGDPLAQVVSQTLTQVSVAFSDAPTFGIPFNITATVSTGNPWNVPVGTVWFVDQPQGVVLDIVPLDELGRAAYDTSLALDEMTGGTHFIQALYFADDTPDSISNHYARSIGGGYVFVAPGPFATASIAPIAQVVESVPGAITAFVSRQCFEDFFIANHNDGGFCGGSIAPSGVVDFVDGDRVFATVAIASDGHVTGDTSSLAAGEHMIHVHYQGDANFLPVDSQLVYLNVLLPTVTYFQNWQSYAVAGQPITLRAFVSPVLEGGDFGVSGLVTFYDAGAPIGTAYAGEGPAQITISSLTLGSHAISAAFRGDGTFAASVSRISGIVVRAANTSTSLSQSPDGFTATVSVQYPGSGTPAGLVLFSVDGAAAAPVALWNGYASFNPQLQPGSHAIVATYLGSASFNGSASDPITAWGPPAAVSLAVSSSANPSAAGAQVTLTVRATAAAGIAKGSINFTDGEYALGYVSLDETGVAMLSFVPGLGTHQIQVSYRGNEEFLPAYGSLAQVVNPAATVTRLSSSEGDIVSGQDVTLVANVSTIVPGVPTPKGTVAFLDGSVTLGIASLDYQGYAAFDTTALKAGKHQLSASYLGIPAYATSGSGPLKFFVDQAGTSLSLQSSVDGDSVFGQQITLSAYVSIEEPGSGVPTGSIEFFDGEIDLGPGNLDDTGAASLQISSLPVGSHYLTASYQGDANFYAPDDATLTQIVDLSRTRAAIASSSNPSVLGQPLSLSVTVTAVAPGAGTPSGYVVFSEGDATLGEASLDKNGTASVYASGLAVGEHSISVYYQGDGTFEGTTSYPLAQIVNQGGVSVVVGSSGSSVYGSPVTFTANVSAASPATGVPGGTVILRDADQTLAILPLAYGSASFITAALTAGSHVIIASYQGDENYQGGATGSVAQNVAIAATSASLAAAPCPAVFGQQITLTATIASYASGMTGQVTFKNDLVTLGSAWLDETGTATLTTYRLAVGKQTLTASYSGDGNFAASSAQATEIIEKAAPGVRLLSSAAPAVFGQTVAFTARVTSEVGRPSGTVTYFDGEQQLGAAVIGISGQAVFATASLSVGTHYLTAVYSGDGSFLTGSAVYSQVVGTGSVAVSLTASQNPLSYGLSVTYTAQVSAGTPGATLPTGNVVFTDGDSTLGTASLTQGFASLQAGSLAAGSHTINAVFSGDDNFAGGSASTLLQEIAQAATATQLSASAQTTVTGEPILLTASVLSTAGLPSGSVTFSDGSTVLGTSEVDSNGKATLPVATLPVSTHFLTATYGGDTNFAGSSAATASVLVGQAATSMTIVSSSTPIGIEQPLTLTALIKVAAPGAGAPSGTVTFSEGVTTLGIGTIDSHGRAVIITNALPAGDHAIFATYNGDQSFRSSASATIGQSVVKSGATLALTSNAATAAFSSPVMLTAKVTASADLESPTGTITFSEGGAALGTSTLDKNANAALALGVLSAGTHTITADYSGDSIHLASAQAQVLQVVTPAATSTALTGIAGAGSLIFTATISTQATTGSPSGTISFMDGSNVLFAGTVGADRTVVFQTLASTASGHSIVAAYGGDANFAASTSSGVTQTVGKTSGCSSTGDTTGGLLLLIGLFALMARSSGSKVKRAA